MTMGNTVAHSVFYNEGILSLQSLVLEHGDGVNDFDVNELHSRTVVDQRGSRLSALEISDSDFYGVNFAIWIRFVTACCHGDLFSELL